jgi:predicted porin
LTGFAKVEWVRSSNQCADCQRYPDEGRHRLWADELVPGTEYGTDSRTVTLIQPWLAAHFDLGHGIKLQGLLSQRWRDGKEDIPGFWYEKNVGLSHEDWGSLRIGAMTTRGWSVADYPYGSDIGVADAWGASGAGYGLLTEAIRYTSRPLDVLGGDLVLEATYDRGNTDFKIHKPRFLEVWAQYRQGGLGLDGVWQDSRNGTPSAWGHGPFYGLTPYPSDDAKLGGSGQSILMLMSRYDITNQWQLSAGVRRNRWSGAYAVLTQWMADGNHRWNDMFNVDWNGSLNGVANPGYAATSTDWSLGLRHNAGEMHYSAGLVRLGKAKTANPSERGQSNGMTLLALGVDFALPHRLKVYGLAGAVRYDHKGQAPLSMPSHSSFSGVDSRVARSGRWAGVGATYNF